MYKKIRGIVTAVGLIAGLWGNAFATDNSTLSTPTPQHSQPQSQKDPGCPGPDCPDQTGGNVPLFPNFHVKQQPKQQAKKEPCCPGPCCPDTAGGPASTPSQQTAND